MFVWSNIAFAVIIFRYTTSIAQRLALDPPLWSLGGSEKRSFWTTAVRWEHLDFAGNSFKKVTPFGKTCGHGQALKPTWNFLSSFFVCEGDKFSAKHPNQK